MRIRCRRLSSAPCLRQCANIRLACHGSSRALQPCRMQRCRARDIELLSPALSLVLSLVTQFSRRCAVTAHRRGKHGETTRRSSTTYIGALRAKLLPGPGTCNAYGRSCRCNFILLRIIGSWRPTDSSRRRRCRCFDPCILNLEDPLCEDCQETREETFIDPAIFISRLINFNLVLHYAEIKDRLGKFNVDGNEYTDWKLLRTLFRNKDVISLKIYSAAE